MHDLDQTRLELEPELDTLEAEEPQDPEAYEPELAEPEGEDPFAEALAPGVEQAELSYLPEAGDGLEGGVDALELDGLAGEADALEAPPEEVNFYAGEALDEGEVDALATELLGVTSDEELDQFLGKLFSRVKRFVASPAGRALAGVVRRVAKKALPLVGGAVGTFFGGPAGTAIGSRLAAGAGRMFGLETEGLSPQDEEWEVARAVVRFGNAAARNLAALPSAALAQPAQAARLAAARAARLHAPGILRPIGGVGAFPAGRRAGRWVRYGRRIVLFGV